MAGSEGPSSDSASKSGGALGLAAKLLKKKRAAQAAEAAKAKVAALEAEARAGGQPVPQGTEAQTEDLMGGITGLPHPGDYPEVDADQVRRWRTRRLVALKYVFGSLIPSVLFYVARVGSR